jgi:GNAT acetyltransferase-like protein
MNMSEINIEVLEASKFDEYQAFVQNNMDTMLYQSEKYITMIQDLLGAKPRHLVARDNLGDMIAVLPALLSPNLGEGIVLNSLPFFGSHGGCILLNGLSQQLHKQVKQELIETFFNLAYEEGCRSATIVAPLFEKEIDIYREASHSDFIVERIGQVTPLPEMTDNIEEEILLNCHSKTRNVIRKSLIQGFELSTEINESILNFLIETHEASISNKGGVFKPPNFFHALMSRYKPGTEIQVFSAWLDGEIVGAVIMLYHGSIAEYFVPVFDDAYRAQQPVTFLIYEAMKDATMKGISMWNWGGTWKTQEGVHHFKKRWGAEDRPYYYFGRIFDKTLRDLDRNNLLKAFPFFFVLPFDD